MTLQESGQLTRIKRFCNKISVTVHILFCHKTYWKENWVVISPFCVCMGLCISEIDIFSITCWHTVLFPVSHTFCPLQSFCYSIILPNHSGIKDSRENITILLVLWWFSYGYIFLESSQPGKVGKICLWSKVLLFIPFFKFCDQMKRKEKHLASMNVAGIIFWRCSCVMHGTYITCVAIPSFFHRGILHINVPHQSCHLFNYL